MGYRELLKKYIRFLEMHAGDNFIESIPDSPEATLTDRDMGEMRTIAAEIFREAHGDPDAARVENYNYRFRILINRYGVSVARAAELAGTDVDTVRRWRTHPRSRKYLPMSAENYLDFEQRIDAWLNDGLDAHDEQAPAAGPADTGDSAADIAFEPPPQARRGS